MRGIPEPSRAGRYRHTADLVPLLDPLHDVLPRSHISENGVDAVEVWLRRMRDEPLASSGIGTRERHTDRAAPVLERIDLITNFVSRTAVSRAGRISILKHEVGNDTMDRDAVEELLLGEPNEVHHRHGGRAARQPNDERAAGGFDRRLPGLPGLSEKARIVSCRLPCL